MTKGTTRALLTLLTGLLSLLAADLSHAQTEPNTGGYVPIFEEVPCTQPAPLDYAMVCGVLRVPEQRDDLTSPFIDLAVVIIRSRSLDPAPDPILYLPGGPGGSITQDAANFFLSNLLNFARERDVIFLDQRGTGASSPRLTCPTIEDAVVATITQNLPPAEERATLATAIDDCFALLSAQGIDLTAYTSAASAADIADLRRALDIAQWNLFSVSYGSRLALTLLRDDPQGVRSVILDSVYPLQVNLFTAYLENADRAFDVLFDACAADTLRCGRAYPDLEATFWRLYERLNAEPEQVRLVNSLTGAETQLWLTGDRLFSWMFSWLYNLDNIRNIPRWLYEIDAGVYGNAARAGLQQDLRILQIDFGLYQAVQCHDEIDFITLEELDALRRAYPQLSSLLARSLNTSETLVNLCARWSPMPTPAIENAPVQSDVPALLLSGEFDPITPPAWGALAAETLSRSTVYTVPGVGHGVVFSSICARRIAVDFLRNPDQPPDAGCLATAGPPFFVITQVR